MLDSSKKILPNKKQLESKHKSIGTSLQFSDQGEFIAISYWRSSEDWSKFLLLKDQTIESLTEMRACLDLETRLDTMQLLSTDLSFGRGAGAEIREQEFVKLTEVRKQSIEKTEVIEPHNPQAGLESVDFREIDFESLNEDTIVLEEEGSEE